VLLTGDEAIRNLNRNFRRKDKATDVLSFPAAEGIEGVAGDLAISLETAFRQAKEHRHTMEMETRVLLLHGLLHLAGYDHETDHGTMRRKEARLRRELGLTAALTERAQRGPVRREAVRA
jgi:probable rRNA maturation factor